jgi:hypothetical protein
MRSRLEKFLSVMSKIENELHIFTTPQLFFQKGNNEACALAARWGELMRHLLPEFFWKNIQI